MNPPLRLRLTAWYALVLAAILAAVGAFVVVRLEEGLEAELDGTLRGAAAQIGVGFGEDGPAGISDVAPSVLPGRRPAAQLLAPGGRVLASWGDHVARRPLLSPAERARALRGGAVIRTVGPFRLAARTARHRGAAGIVVAAESLEDVHRAVHRALVALLLAGPAALAAAALGGWWLAGRALRPVDRMAARAARIGPDRLDERLAVPAARDELARLAETLNGMLDRLERGVREQQRLVADASHELRTPLAAMRAELDVSLRADALSPAAREVLLSTREEADRMSRTVADLLTLAAADDGRMQLLAAPLDLADIARAAAGELAAPAEARRVRIVLDGTGAPAHGDAERLRHALRNLIENAIKFGPAGGTVTVSAWTRGGESGVTVRDEGGGIPPALRERVFDRFFRVEAARGRASGGSGLGLSIARAVADAHHGRVWAEGSAFSLALPAQSSSDGPGGDAPGRARVSAATRQASSAPATTAAGSESASAPSPRIRR